MVKLGTGSFGKADTSMLANRCAHCHGRFGDKLPYGEALTLTVCKKCLENAHKAFARWFKIASPTQQEVSVSPPKKTQ